MTWFILTAAYVGVAVLLLSLNIASRWPLSIRMGAVVLVSVLYAGTWLGLGSLRGTPTDAALPAEFRLNWVQVEEPDKSTGSAGAIYYWIRPLDDAGQPLEEPRSHVVPFGQETARAARQAQEALLKGARINGYLTRGLFRPEAGSPDAGAAGQGAGSSDDGSPQFEFRPVDKPALPPKGVPGAERAPARGG